MYEIIKISEEQARDMLYAYDNSIIDTTISNWKKRGFIKQSAVEFFKKMNYTNYPMDDVVEAANAAIAELQGKI